ncbi:ATP-binding protein [Marinilabilia rubra]|uniref:ATPase n=1 Tax=Marinilabilia rubra TaxID=2162893 RepID=A0A2U2B3C2_9BACT|nr:ATP-binding protein [Marinilabilia rubra]PWD97563.1 ATPase [Marinilabilia rubra]
MKFYDRIKELELLRKTEKKSRSHAQMSIVLGRRRIGKTTLLIESVKNLPHLYFFISKKNEVLLCEEFIEEVKSKLSVNIYGTFKSFRDLFGYLLDLSSSRPFTLIIDEFQEFISINPSVYSEIQNIWDNSKNKSKINLIFCGSVYSMMKKIFEDAKEPLFGRATQKLYIKPFDIETQKRILAEHNPQYSQDDLLALYMITGGIPKYLEVLIENEAFNFNDMIDVALSENSVLIEEGKNVLIDEFGKDYGNYFSILSLIASSKTSRPEMESILEIQTGGYLDRLENDFGIISKIKPILAKPNSRSVKYQISDNFLNFWFRFIYKYKSAIEIDNLEYVKNIIKRDYNVYSGKVLERYFIEKLKAERNYSTIGSYWEKGNKNEIDIVAINEAERKIYFYEIKRNPANININDLIIKSSGLTKKLSEFKSEYNGLSLEDM